MTEIVRLDIPAPGVCQVMFCIATDHDGGTLHYDGTGHTFGSCTHGVLDYWPPCEACGYGDTTDQVGDLLDALMRRYRATVALRNVQVTRSGERGGYVRLIDAQLQIYRYAIGAAVSVRLGRDLSGDDVKVTALVTIAAGRTYVESIPAE